MNVRVLSILGALVLTAGNPLSAHATEAQAPPMLTPLVARDVAAACPGTGTYTDALVRGATAEQAAAAAPLFETCAISLHRRFPWREPPVHVAAGAAYLSRGLLETDPVMLQHAIGATGALRSRVSLTDDAVRRWTIIPDDYDARRHEEVIRTDCPASMWLADATYINVAARQGSAWVTAPRDTEACKKSVAYFDRGVLPLFGDPSPQGIPPVDYSARREPAFEPGFNSPVIPAP